MKLEDRVISLEEKLNFKTLLLMELEKDHGDLIDIIKDMKKEIETMQNRLGQFLINSQPSTQYTTKCAHTHTEQFLSFNNFELKEHITGIYTFCLDCRTKLI